MARNSDHLMRRFRGESPQKMRSLAERSASGSMNSFQGVFQVPPATAEQMRELAESLAPYLPQGRAQIERDAEQLLQLLLEVKAISHQALLLHGERIQRAQAILRDYGEGAFTTWLLRAYGNRQTPYNLLQYYEFFLSLPKADRSRFEGLPRQIAYQLASRRDPQQKKLALLERLANAPKRDLGALLRRELPLGPSDRRNRRPSEVARGLLRVRHLLKEGLISLTEEELGQAEALIAEISEFLARRRSHRQQRVRR